MIAAPLHNMKRTPLALIFLIVFIDLLGFGIVIPILPSYAQRGFAADDLTVGFLVASYSFMQLLFTPLWGRLSDKIGRKPVLLIGLFLTMIGYVIFGLANTLLILFASRLLSGVGGANISAAQAYIADVTSLEQRAKGMGVLGAAFGLGFVFGPFIGGFLSQYGYEVPGFFAAGLSFVSMVLTAILLPESRTKETRTRSISSRFSFKQLFEFFSRPKTGVLLLFFFLVTFAYANIYAAFPIISNKEFGYSDAMVGGLFAFIGLIGALTQGVFIRYLTAKYSERTLFLAGCILTMIGLTLIPFYVSTAVLLIVLTVLSLGAGTTTPTCLSMISKSADADEQGSLLGINQSMGALARVLGPIWGGFTFQTFGHIWPFITGGAVMFIVVILVRNTLWKSSPTISA
jgi:multidrug resistance protein